MGDKSPKNNAKIHKQADKNSKKKVEAPRGGGAAAIAAAPTPKKK